MVDIIDDMQIVVFTLGKEEYGIDIYKVQEIIRLLEVTRLPDTDAYVLGVINLRGGIVPLIDLKKKLMHSESEYTDETRVLVVEVGSKKVGLIVDEVSEVVRIPADGVIKAEAIGDCVSSQYLLGVANMDNRLLIPLKIDELF